MTVFGFLMVGFYFLGKVARRMGMQSSVPSKDGFDAALFRS
jgi:hypothetical protein